MSYFKWLILSSCQIRLHSSVAYIRDPLFQLSEKEKARNACLEGMHGIRGITHYVIDYGMIDRLGPPFAFTLWVAGRVMLVDKSKVKSLEFIDALKMMGQHWQVALSYSETLERVHRDYHKDIRGAPSASCQILADMRRCAFDTIFVIERQP